MLREGDDNHRTLPFCRQEGSAGPCLAEVIVEVVDGRLAVEAKVDNAAALHDECAVKQGEGVRRRAVDGGTDGDAPFHQTPHHAYHLHKAVPASRESRIAVRALATIITCRPHSAGQGSPEASLATQHQ